MASNTDVINVSEPGADGLTKGERVGGMGEGMKEGKGWRAENGGWRVEVWGGKRRICLSEIEVDVSKDTRRVALKTLYGVRMCGLE